MLIDYRQAEGDVFELACLYVVVCDVVSKQQKRDIMRRLAHKKLTVHCPEGGCGGCSRRAACEDYASAIMAS